MYRIKPTGLLLLLGALMSWFDGARQPRLSSRDHRVAKITPYRTDTLLVTIYEGDNFSYQEISTADLALPAGMVLDNVLSPLAGPVVFVEFDPETKAVVRRLDGYKRPEALLPILGK